MNTIMSAGFQGMHASSLSMNSSAHAIASLATQKLPDDSAPQAVSAPNAPLQPTDIQTTSSHQHDQSLDLAENLINMQRQAQIFTASASVVKMGSEAVGSLIDDYG